MPAELKTRVNIVPPDGALLFSHLYFTVPAALAVIFPSNLVVASNFPQLVLVVDALVPVTWKITGAFKFTVTWAVLVLDPQCAVIVYVVDEPGVYFTTPHFDGYPAVLVKLAEIDVSDLEELITEAWLTQAPKKLVKDYLAELC